MITEKQKDGFIYLEVITMFVCVCTHVCFQALCFSPVLVECMVLSLIVQYNRL